MHHLVPLVLLTFICFCQQYNKEAYDYMDFALFKMHRVSWLP